MMRAFARLRRTLNPRRSVAARLLLEFFLAFFIPATVFVLVLERRLSNLEEQAIQKLGASRVAQRMMLLRQDADLRAEWIDRRVRAVEESAWSLAKSTELALTGPNGGKLRSLPSPDEHGHIWTRTPEHDTVALLTPARAADPAARLDFVRTRAVAPLLKALLQRQRTIKSVGIWTASGVVRHCPWVEIHEAIRQSGGELERFVFNRRARFSPLRPATGDVPIWTPALEGPRLSAESRFVSLFVPVRSEEGELIAGISMEVDARHCIAEAAGKGQSPADVWFSTDSVGHALLMTAEAAELLRWEGTPTETLADSREPGRQTLSRSILGNGRATVAYSSHGKTHNLVSAKVPSTGWVFVEGLRAAAINAIGSEAKDEVRSLAFSGLKRDVVLFSVYLLLAVLAVVVLISRRISAPVSQLVLAAEKIGRGRSVELSRDAKQDELGRLAVAVDRMGKRVERRVETLSRLHALFRAAYRTTDLQEVLARASEAIAAFTRAERVWFFLHDADTNRLEAAWPGWNLPEELAGQLKISVESRSIEAMVFQSGEVYLTNDLEHDPYANQKLRVIVGGVNGIFCPLKAEDKTLGVVVATNRLGGFGHEEADALTSFADAASLLIYNVRLYATLTGTVEELRRASRLKDHFLQNVNHELRTPLTSIVGWTDLLEEQEVDESTLRRGLKQVRQSARVLLALIDDLLDLARMDRGALSLDLKSVVLCDVIQRSLETVRLMADARGVVLILAPLPNSMPPVRADPLRLQQILWNLLANSIKFTPRHGRVIVRVDREPERYLVSVEDDGIGIPESELPHVFERFRQVDGSPTRRHSGMGIGLALARSLVELHGGTIWAESILDHGSRFTFSLPLRPGERRTGESVAAETSAQEDEISAKESSDQMVGRGEVGTR